MLKRDVQGDGCIRIFVGVIEFQKKMETIA